MDSVRGSHCGTVGYVTVITTVLINFPPWLLFPFATADVGGFRFFFLGNL